MVAGDLLFAGKKVLVVGLGLLGGGIGSTKFLVEEGAVVTVTDLKTKEELRPSLQKLDGYTIQYRLGRHDEQDLDGVDFLLRNPGVPREAPILVAAKKRKIPIEMDASLFVKLSGRGNIIGVTGTRGKSTTVTLIAEIFKASSLPVTLGGNIPGGSMLAIFRTIKPRSVIILELSSWQLQGFAEARLSPRTSVITNIFPDHLNRYRTIADYIRDKKTVYLFQGEEDTLFLHRENPFTPTFAAEAPGSVHLFSARDIPASWKLIVPGEHNRANAAAAKAVGDLFHVDPRVIKKTIETFPGLAHRLELVRFVCGVTYVNDSASTMPEATIAAIRAQTAPIVLIAGGNDKKLDYEPLGKLINRRVKGVILLAGDGTEKLARTLRKGRVKAHTMSLPRAVAAAQRYATPGDVVLFSPAFTSFGLFDNEFQRGEKFKEIVRTM